MSSNQQRKGQFLFNEISKTFIAKDQQASNNKICNVLWNISDEDFQKIMDKLEPEGKELEDMTNEELKKTLEDANLMEENIIESIGEIEEEMVKRGMKV